MAAAFVTEQQERFLALDVEDDFLEPPHFRATLVDDLDFQPPSLAESQVHLVEVAGEEGGLLTACAGANLEDHRFDGGVLIADHGGLELFEEGFGLLLELLGLGLGELAHVVSDVGFVEHRARLGQCVAELAILAEGLDEAAEPA